MARTKRNTVSRVGEKVGFSIYSPRLEDQIDGEKYHWKCNKCGRVWLLQADARGCPHQNTIHRGLNFKIHCTERLEGEMTDEEILAEKEVMRKARIERNMRREKLMISVGAIKREMSQFFRFGTVYFSFKDSAPEGRMEELQAESIKRIQKKNEENGSPLQIHEELIREVFKKRFNAGVLHSFEGRTQ